MEYIRIGRIVNTFGLKGELKIASVSDFDELRYKKGNTVYILHEGKYLPFTCATFRVHKGFSMVSFEGMPDINLVECYKTDDIFIDAQSRHRLADGEYYRDQVIGLMAVDEDGRNIGRVIGVEETSGAQNNLRIARENNSDVLVPNVPEFVKEVNLETKTIVIHVEEGLL